jgi:hypothetical protein
MFADKTQLAVVGAPDELPCLGDDGPVYPLHRLGVVPSSYGFRQPFVVCGEKEQSRRDG